MEISSPSMSTRKKEKKKEKEMTLTSLPEDLLLSCLARVSRLYYRTLSFVSKRFQSILASPELYKVRSLSGNTERCLYVCIEFDSGPNYCWFTLCQKPNQTLTNDHIGKNNNKNSSGYVLAKVSIPDSPPAIASGLIAVGSSIYNIGESISSSSVSILDCTTHTWRKATSFPVKLCSFSASVADQKIHVAGCYIDKDDNSYLKNTFQVLDTKTLIWDSMPIPCSYMYRSFDHQSICIDRKFHVKGRETEEVVAYNSKEGGWDVVESRMGVCMRSEDTYCVIENVLYSAYGGYIRWYDTEVREWRKLMGLVGVRTDVILVDYSGKMMVLWDEYIISDRSKKKMILCAEITVEKRKDGEIWGKVEWYDNVLTIPNSCSFIKGIVATV